MVKPRARSAYIAPRLTPLMTCCSRMSQKVTSVPRAARRDAETSRAGRRRSLVLLLMDDVVVGEFRIVPVLEDADDLRHHVAVLIEGHLALQRLELGRLHGIADVGAIDLLAALD